MNPHTNISIAPGLDGYFAKVDTAGTGRKVPAVVVLMEAFGLKPHIRRVCDRLAAAGIAALAPDLFHGECFDYSDMNSVMGKLAALKDDQMMREIGLSLDLLAGMPGIAADRLGVTGFCMGGRLSFLSACEHASRIVGAVSFYGGGIAPTADHFGRTPPIESAEALSAPLLLIYGGKDAHIALDERTRIAQRLGELNKPFTLSLYPEGDHGFCCADRASYHAESAALAYAQMTSFFQRHLLA